MDCPDANGSLAPMKATIVVDPMFGDGGKGAAVDYLAEDADLIVRFNGGAQASHTIQDDEYLYHAGLLGSGLLRGIPVFLSEHVRVDLIAIGKEREALLQSPLQNRKPVVIIDLKALLVTPYHVEASQKAARVSQKGTTGMGVGESGRNAMAHPETAIVARDLTSRPKLIQKLWGQMWDYRSRLDPEKIADDFIRIAGSIVLQSWDARNHRKKTYIFEGSGGYYLDPEKGFRPYVTSTRTTPIHAVRMILEAGRQEEVYYEIVGVLPIFTTRHGPGPFPTEEPRLSRFLLPPGEVVTLGQGPKLSGWLDLDLAKAALKDMHVDKLHVSHLDLWETIPFWKVHYNGKTVDVATRAEMIKFIEYFTEVPISVVAYGPKRSDRRPYERE